MQQVAFVLALACLACAGQLCSANVNAAGARASLHKEQGIPWKVSGDEAQHKRFADMKQSPSTRRGGGPKSLKALTMLLSYVNPAAGWQATSIRPTWALNKPVDTIASKHSRELLRHLHIEPRFSSSLIRNRLSKALSMKDDGVPLPREVLPVTLSVFSQMIGEGIAISSLPLYLTRMGATPVQVGMATSCFSVAQMFCCPLLVRSSGRVGRGKILQVCLAGATVSNIGIACSPSVAAIVVCRFLAGVFAAAVPVAQAAVADVVSSSQMPTALSRVAAASQLAIVVGPMCSALFMNGFALAGVPAKLQLRCVFASAAAFALGVLAFLSSSFKDITPETSEMKGAGNKANSSDSSAKPTVREFPVQPLLRIVALVIGWSLTLSVYGYGLFAPKIMGYEQEQLSATYSAGALTTIGAQVVFPKLVDLIGVHATSCLGLSLLATGMGCFTLVRDQPFHSLLYLLNRAGAGVADTSVANLVAITSKDKDDRARNLGLIQSTRAAARIFTPLLSGSLFAVSCTYSRAMGSLPFLCNAACALLVSPLPFLLERIERRKSKTEGRE